MPTLVVVVVCLPMLKSILWDDRCRIGLVFRPGSSGPYVFWVAGKIPLPLHQSESLRYIHIC